MKYQELKKSLQDGAKPIYLICGQDGFLRENALRLLKETFLTEPDLNLTNFTGEQVKQEPSALLNAVNSYPFLSDKRFVVINEYYPTQKDLKVNAIKEVFESDFEFSVLIIINVNQKCDALTKNSKVTVVDCERADDILITRWIRAEALKSQVVVNGEACSLLIEYSNGDLTKISREVQKLISFVGENSQITENEVKSVCAKSSEYEVYELSENIAKKNYGKALELLNDMLANNEDKQRLFISIYFHFRRLLHASISKASNLELAETLGVKEFAVKIAKQQAKNFTPKRLKQICDKLSLLDGKFKSGDLGIDTALWTAVFNAMKE